ncbi:MAG: 2-phosphosulfolactate phosphatase [Thermoplasmata archaeon]|jgi:2-phosphosulfolactate phosphatase|nr:hypothetical protein [Euryarchaeota archaeon]MVT35199.1 hypothetical protein [Euryarchaeota archaeon]
MNIVDGSKIEKIRAKNAVLIDVFRATTSIVVMMKRGVEEIIPFESEEKARLFIKKHNDYVSVGEREGIKIEDFDHGNSPVELMKAPLEGKKVVFVSTNGTRVLSKIIAEKVYIGSFLNADNIAKIIDEETVLVCANRLNLYSIEDFLCASYIKGKHMGIHMDFERIKNIILKSKSADRLRKLNAEDDMLFSLSLNLIPIVPVYRNGIIREVLL